MLEDEKLRGALSPYLQTKHFALELSKWVTLTRSSLELVIFVEASWLVVNLWIYLKIVNNSQSFFTAYPNQTHSQLLRSRFDLN